MMTERYGALFWVAVAVLMSRVLLELARGLKTLWGHAAIRLAVGIGPPQVIFVAPSRNPSEPLLPHEPKPRPTGQPATPAAPNLLETMSHEEMDRLLQPRG